MLVLKVLSPNEVRRTWPISMARLDLRFIILGGGDPGHQSERVLQLSLVFNIFYNIRSALPLASSTPPPLGPAQLHLSSLSSPSSLLQWILSGA